MTLAKKSIPFLYFAEIPSTHILSERIADQSLFFINGNEASQFFVVARRQTAGKGRGEKLFASDEGGIYFNWVVRCKNSFDFSVLSPGNIMQNVSLCLRDAIRNCCKLQLNLKWPNDLFFNSYKIAGIMSQYISRGDLCYFNIGIGINHHNDLRYTCSEAGSLAQFSAVASRISALGLTSMLCHELSQHEESIFRRNSSEIFLNGSSPLARIWYKQGREYYWISAQRDGGLLLEDSLSKEKSRHFNLDSQWANALSIVLAKDKVNSGDSCDSKAKGQNISKNIVLIDLGNTRIKIRHALLEGKELLIKLGEEHSDGIENSQFSAREWLQKKWFPKFSAVPSSIDSKEGSNPPLVYICSVNDVMLSKINQAVTEQGGAGNYFHEIPRERKRTHGNYDLQQIGLDRLIYIEGAATLFDRLQDLDFCMAISLGTATTVDVLDRNLEHLSGIIGPGVQLMASSLHQHTSKLPLVQELNFNSYIKFEEQISDASTTKDAISCGIWAAQLGMIEKMLHCSRQQLKAQGRLSQKGAILVRGGGGGDAEFWNSFAEANEVKYFPGDDFFWQGFHGYL